MVSSDVIQSVGQTPLVALRRLDTAGASVFVKIESRNPCGSVKDRVGVALVEDAERRGVLSPVLAFVAAAKGYRLTLTIPEHISKEAWPSCACSAPRSSLRRAR